jgi:hypothetical protein
MGATVIPFDPGRVNLRRIEHAHGAPDAKARWLRGLTVPHRITLALDICKLDGPEVDKACGVQEPAVDLWECGTLYPTWEQLLRLAALTDFPVAFFTAPTASGLPMLVNTHRLLNGRTLCEPVQQERPVVAFTQAAIRRTLGGGTTPRGGGRRA